MAEGLAHSLYFLYYSCCLRWINKEKMHKMNIIMYLCTFMHLFKIIKLLKHISETTILLSLADAAERHRPLSPRRRR